MVDKLSNYAHFMPLKHPYTAKSIVVVFMDTIVSLYRLPDTIISDRDVVFLRYFWQDLFTLQGFQLNTSSAFHPPNGQTVVFNRCLET